MTKITLLGAGSGFTQPLFTDILNITGLDEGVIGLVDIDGARLAVNVKLLHRILELMGKKGWRVEASTDRRKILPGTDYLISTIEVSGVACVRADNDIPMKYGIDQCIGDTVGPGGVMKALTFEYSIPRYLLTGMLDRRWPRVALSAIAPVRLREIPEPELPGDDWVRVKPRVSGLCGSDMGIILCHESLTMQPFASYPFVLGHEVCADIIETGSRV